MKLIELSRPLAALQVLAAESPLLPAAHIDINDIFPTRITLSFHKDLGDFEAWREALGIDPGTVRHSLQSGDMTLVLTGFAVRDGITFQLMAYGPNAAMLLGAVAA